MESSSSLTESQATSDNESVSGSANEDSNDSPSTDADTESDAEGAGKDSHVEPPGTDEWRLLPGPSTAPPDHMYATIDDARCVHTGR